METIYCLKQISILSIIEMISAVIFVKSENGLTGQGGYELDLLLITIAISLLLSVPGRISIERDVLKRENFRHCTRETKINKTSKIF